MPSYGKIAGIVNTDETETFPSPHNQLPIKPSSCTASFNWNCTVYPNFINRKLHQWKGNSSIIRLLIAARANQIGVSRRTQIFKLLTATVPNLNTSRPRNNEQLKTIWFFLLSREEFISGVTCLRAGGTLGMQFSRNFCFLFGQGIGGRWMQPIWLVLCLIRCFVRCTSANRVTTGAAIYKRVGKPGQDKYDATNYIVKLGILVCRCRMLLSTLT